MNTRIAYIDIMRPFAESVLQWYVCCALCLIVILSLYYIMSLSFNLFQQCKQSANVECTMGL